ncbi:DNA/RNA helicase domain-containing protein, partial [Planococcus sp. SIMBA_143]
EAHRLNEKSGMFQNLGENQVKEIIHASKLAIFFIDERQRVTLKDHGSIEVIQKFAELEGAEMTTLKLESQFRCNGSDGYLAWVDDVLQISET